MTTLQRRSEVLSALEFQQVTEVPPEVEAFANLRNSNTRKAYRRDGRDFTAYAGLQQPEGFRRVTRAHVVAWRAHLLAQELSPATIRRKLAAPGFLYTYLSDRNAIECNPLAGVNRPSNATTRRECASTALSAAQACAAPSARRANRRANRPWFHLRLPRCRRARG